MSPRKYRYATDQMICDYLASLGAPPKSFFIVDGELYGYLDSDGIEMLVMDDDDERVEMVLAYLRRTGGDDRSAQPSNQS